jgi:phosphatidate phosphatase APP1
MNLFKKDPLQIITFDSYGTNSHLYLRGRALEDESINLDSKGWFHLFLNTWKRMESDEVKYANIKIILPNGQVFKTKTDNHGYFKLKVKVENLKELIDREGWVNFEVAYADSDIKRIIQNKNKFPAKTLVPSSKAAYGIISDIDDTILQTGVVSTLKWRVLFNTAFKAAKKRLPLKGAPEFYNLLHKGKNGDNANPVFYVSHSPWNLYRYLNLFLQQNNFPEGPILLRTMKSFFKRKGLDYKPQKQIEILNILKTYPHLPMILIGDSGEHDADIYKEIAELYPDKIAAIYLRSVNHKKRMIRAKGLFDNYKATPILFVEDSEQAVHHAKKMGFI